LRRHGGATGFLFRGYSPCRCLRDGYRIWVCRLRFFGSSCPISPTTLSLLRYFLRTTTAMAKQKITGDELSARAKANGYQRGVYRDKDSLRDRRECYVSMAEVHTSDCQKDFRLSYPSEAKGRIRHIQVRRYSTGKFKCVELSQSYRPRRRATTSLHFHFVLYCISATLKI
jgi:hypothetical protein